MGLIYDSSDSDNLINGLTSNLESSKEAVSRLKAGSKQVISAVDGHNLSGAAYKAGAGLFKNLILPVVDRVTDAIDQIESDLKTYNSANSEICSEGYLNEDNLKNQISQKEGMINSIQVELNFLNSINSMDLETTNRLLDAKKKLLEMSDQLRKDIRKLEKKIKKLHKFSTSTNSLFKDSLSSLNKSMNCLLLLDNVIVHADGSYDFSLFDIGMQKKLQQFQNEMGNNMTIIDWLEEGTSSLFDGIKDTVIKRGKHLGLSWGAKLQPKGTHGTGFVKDSNKVQSWMSRRLKKMKKPTSNNLGKVAKIGGPALIGFDAYNNYTEFNEELNKGHKNRGRALAYSGVATGAGLGAGVVGASAGTALVGYAEATSLLAVAGAPIVGAVFVGAAAAAGIKAMYTNFKPFKDVVNTTGDALNSVGKKIVEFKDGVEYEATRIKKKAINVGKSLSNSLGKLKGAFSW
ncbi:T7SS effector LXG polymorphic toxin [Xylocopilactobacillus apicola]|uniref:LXG domain-containing protein n=1 Tax=Xylocopilactobacillus apicola TaxID=2932184 RepID=A0AAU9DYX6_9LACO|nr:T7SS effector LXG polymorphic toxin [Xylocopilactobacillus apicola]BDR59418.1 hypothetical protein XA3_18590 [Xylocopilactobacillus apicola]